MRHRRKAIACLGALAAAGAAGADIIDVPGDAPTIQVAINIAVDGDEIVVAPGTYFESLRLLGKEITLRSSGGPDVTTIDAFGQFDSAIHAVAGETLATVLEGFTIQRGNADGIDDGDPQADERGGGLFVNDSSITVVDCVFFDNVASNVGGGFYVNNGTVSFTGCTFELNEAGMGGGAYLNSATGTFTDCDILNNDAVAFSGGAIRSISSTTTLLRCRLVGNTTVESGGGVDVTGTLIATACEFIANEALNGGGLFVTGTATVRDSILNGNFASGTGGGAYVNAPSGSLTMVNATVAHSGGPGAAVFREGGTTVLTNCVLWANASGDVAGSPTVTYSILQGGSGTNKDADPLFVDPAGADATTGTADDDLRLSAGSPAIDAANASVVTGQYPVDLDGNPRAADDPDTADTGLAVLGLSVDMGAYELQPAGGNPTCPSDIDGDGSVGTSDLLLLLSTWGPCP